MKLKAGSGNYTRGMGRGGGDEGESNGRNGVGRGDVM